MFTVKRSTDNPLLSPNGEHHWEAAAAFNGCPVKDGSLTHLVYRGLSERELLEEPKINRSIVARATTKNGKDFYGRVPFIFPEHDFEKYGCEDPRVTKLGGKFFIFYTALSNYPFDASGIKVALAISKDMKTVTEKHLVTPFNAKAMALFPKKINGKYAALLSVDTDNPPASVAYAEFDSLDDIWSESYWKKWYKKRESHAIPLHRADGDHVELGAPPVKVKEGWLVVYSHIRNYGRGDTSFGIEAVLLDAKNPRRIIGRTKGPFLVPEEHYEITGYVPRVIFPSGALVSGDKLEVYYGATDTYTCKATVPLQDLINSMLPKTPPLVKRFAGNPVVSAREGKDWEAHGTFNPGAIDLGGRIHLMYRSMSEDDTSTIGYASSRDGFSIDERSDAPVYTPRAEFETKSEPGYSGCEDPRVVQIGKRIYMIYTAYNGSTPKVAITEISEKDFLEKKWSSWSEPLVVTPPETPNKDGCLVPEKTANGYIFLHRVGHSICADTLSSLDFTKERVVKCIEMISPRKGMWDEAKVGIAGPPLKTKEGWLLFYHGVSASGIYRVGAALLDKKDPTIVLARTAAPIFEPTEGYEKEGVVSDVVFPCGCIVRRDTIYLYYGGGDKVVGVATLSLEKILKILTWKK